MVTSRSYGFWDSLAPNNVRSSESFQNYDASEAISAYGAAVRDAELVLLGVPEQDEFLDRASELLDSRRFDTVYAKPGYAEEAKNLFDADVAVIEYEGEQSRRADLEELEEMRLPNENLLLATWSYNVPRTNTEAAKALSLDGLDDGYPLRFNDFAEMNVREAGPRELLSGAAYTAGDSLPFLSPVADPIGDLLSGEVDLSGGMEYETFDLEEPIYLTIGVPWSDDPREIGKRHAMESFKAGSSESWQEAKDHLKKLGRTVSDDFNF